MRSFLLMALFVGCAAPPPFPPCERVRLDRVFDPRGINGVDLLFVIDDSPSMEEEQAALVDALPVLVRSLSQPPGDDGRPPVDDLHIGVVSADLGSAGFDVPGCDPGGAVQLSRRSCTPSTPSFIAFDPTIDSAASITCAVQTGTTGCEYEQPLEAALRVLTPPGARSWTSAGFAAPSFPGGIVGDRSSGFLRDHALLAIVVLSNEDDCSVADAELLNPDNPVYAATPPNRRCAMHESSTLHPVERFVDGLVQLRQHPGEIVFLPIVGVPIDLAWDRSISIESPTWTQLTSDEDRRRDPRMWPQPHPTAPGELAPACTHAERGEATPAVRLARVAAGIHGAGGRVGIRSICEASFEPALEELARVLRSWSGPACLPLSVGMRTLPWEARDCDVHLLLPIDASCDELRGASLDGVESGRERCRVDLLTPTIRAPGDPEPPGDGWYRDIRPSGCAERVAFTFEVPPYTEARLLCLTPDLRPGFPPLGRGLGCLDRSECDEFGLVCDPIWSVCNVQCETDSDCDEGGLPGFLCDRRPLRLVDPGRRHGDEMPYDICVQPPGC